MNQIVTIIVVLLKYLIPFTFLAFPFFGSISNYFLDIVDGDLLQSLGMDEPTYQFIDKSADYVTYIFMAIAARKWKVNKLVYILFAYRTIGQLLFFITDNEFVFFLFQNFLEPFFIIYSFILTKNKFNHERTYESYKRHKKAIWIGIIIYKVWNEWYLHWANIDLSTIFFGVDGSMR